MDKTDANPADANPADANPADANPADAKPADAKPADVNPVDANSAASNIPYMDEIARLTKIIEEQKRQRQEEERQRQEEERQRQEEERQRQEELAAAAEQVQSERRRRVAAEEAARVERRRRIDAERDAVAAAAAHQRDLEESRRMQLDQTLRAYLADVHRLSFMASRLAPTGMSIVRTLSENRSSKSTTNGRTNIFGKYYPLTMRAWPGFREACQAAFHRIETALDPRRCFPSALAMLSQEEELKQRLPTEFLDSEAFRNENRTSIFLDSTLQMPAQRIMNAYLAAAVDGPQKKLFFDNDTAGWHTQVSNTTTAESTDESQEGDGVGDGTRNSAARLKPPVKTRPDCLVLCANVLPDESAEAVSISADDEDDADDAEDAGDGEQEQGSAATQVRRVYRITVGEHKALHRLRSAVVSRFLQGPIDEDFMVRLAKSTKSASASQGAALEAAQNTTQGTAREAALGANLPDVPPGQVFFARALTQAFHYMITSGIEYGYVATGETLTLLKIARDDPTVLHYHTVLFPQYCRALPDGEASTVANTTGPLAVAMLCGLCLLAYESSAEPPRQRSINIARLAPFPKIPPFLVEEAARQQRTPGPTRSPSRDNSRDRRRPRDDGGDDDDDADDGQGHQGRMPYRALRHQSRQSSPLKRQRAAEDTLDRDVCVSWKRQRIGQLPMDRPLPVSRFDPSSFRPIRPYCTQACLKGLVEGTCLDRSCPNVTLHLEALCARTGSRRPAVHAITKTELHGLLRQQLFANSEQDCTCLLDDGFRGAVGCLFQITLTGYGYTFVAKGVEQHNRKVLRHEEHVYAHLAPHQGLLIPVCLGVIKLRLPYPMANCTLVTHMLLMSFAGLPLYSRKLAALRKTRRVDFDAEARRTMQQLEADGLHEQDDESNGNLTWCVETGRVMKIDFDQARILQPRRHGDSSAARTAQKAQTAHAVLKTMDDASFTTGDPVPSRPSASLVDSMLLA